MKNKIICYFLGHKFNHAEYDVISVLGTLFMHCGLHAVCSRCNCHRDIEEDENDLPVLLPRCSE